MLMLNDAGIVYSKELIGLNGWRRRKKLVPRAAAVFAWQLKLWLFDVNRHHQF